jgi:hypothetical protein
VKRAVAIGLKIPDNEAYTALVTLQRLGVAVGRVERNVILRVDDEGDAAVLAARVKSDEAAFNPNKHRLAVLEANAPREGEVWVESLDGKRCTAWRLIDAKGAPVSRDVLGSAIERLLCNPAIERATY